MEVKKYDDVIETARTYYNSDDADNFYFKIWGGEDIHIGKYDSDEGSIFEASRKTVEDMASQCSKLDKDSQVLDLGSGYGGAARYLAKKYGCHVTALNLSEKENQRNRQMNKVQGLDHLIKVVDGNFEDLPFADKSFDLVWSQDAILHSGKRQKVISEVSRVLKDNGEFIFTDPMMDDNCPQDVLQPILDRINLATLGSPAFYREACQENGLKEQGFKNYTTQLPRHYSRVLQELEKKEAELKDMVSEQYIKNMKKGLKHWVDGGNKGHLAWGIFHFQKQ